MLRETLIKQMARHLSKEHRELIELLGAASERPRTQVDRSPVSPYARSKLLRSILVGALLTSSASLSTLADATPIRAIVTQPLPQAYIDSCQSYGMALSLALLVPELHSVRTSTELRNLERQIFAYLGTVSGKGNEENWPGWFKAVGHFSGGRMMLVAEWFRSDAALLDRLHELTGLIVHDARAEFEVLLSARQPVMLSLNRIGERDFTSGHIVTVIGTGDTPTSPRPLHIVNPSIETSAGHRRMCSEYDTQTDAKPWKAMVSPVTEYAFNPQKLVIWCIRPLTNVKNPKCDGG